MEMDIKKVLNSKKFTLPATAAITFLLTLALSGRDSKEQFADQQEASIYTIDAESGKRILNRRYFDPSTFKAVDWANMSNAEIGNLLGETAAKELAMDIDSINRRLATPGKLFGLDYNYCNKSVTNAIVDATKRMKFRNNCFGGRPFAKKAGRNEALYNGDHLIHYFAADSIPGTVIKNPTKETFKTINPGAVVRFPGHTKMFVGIGFVDGTNEVFVPDAAGKPVVVSGYNERFSYFEGGECTVIDIARVVEYNLGKSGRNR